MIECTQTIHKKILKIVLQLCKRLLQQGIQIFLNYNKHSMEGKKTIYSKLVEVRKEIWGMEKSGFNDMQKYKYFSDDQIAEKFRSLFNKFWIAFEYSSKITGHHEISPTGKWTKQFVTDVEVEYKFVDIETGDFVSWFACWSGNDTGDKWVYKAITGAVKYIFMKTFQISTGDDPETDNVKERKPWSKEVAKKTSVETDDDNVFPDFPNFWTKPFEESAFNGFKQAVEAWSFDVTDIDWSINTMKQKYNISPKREAEIRWFIALRK